MVHVFNRLFFRRLIACVPAIIAGTMLLAAADTLAQQPGAPRDVTAKWSTTANAAVTVQWMAPDSGTVTSYVVYAAVGELQSTTVGNWHIVGTTLAASTSLMVSLTDLKLTSPQTTSFYVKSVLITLLKDTLRSEASNIAVAVWDTGSAALTLRFKSEPVRMAVVGKLYSYQAVAVSSDSTAVITYALVKGPAGMVIDSTKGTVTWTPTQAQQGMVEVLISATDNHGNTVQQDFMVLVQGSTNQNANVSGTITDAVTGKVIAGARVTFTTILDSILPPVMKPITILTDDSGMFNLILPVGSYSVRAEAQGYVTTFLGNVDSFPGTVLKVVLNTADTANIALKPLPMGMLTGRVTNAVTGKAIVDAMITVILKGRDSTGIQIPGYGNQFQVETNDSGFYSLRLPVGAYIVRADAKDFFGVWFNGIDSIKLATVVTITANTTDTVNFQLKPKPEQEICTISGRVVNANDSAVAGAKVTVIMIDPDDRDDGDLFKSTVTTDANGRYTDSVVCGATYIVSARADGFIGVFWKNKHNPLTADRINLATNVDSIDFVLYQQPASKTTLSGTVFGCDSVRTALPAHVIAYLILQGDLVAVANTETDSNGFYTFQNLSAGAYVIQAISLNHAFVPGYYTAQNQCTFDWRRAAIVRVTDSTTIAGLDIFLHETKHHHGFAHVHGHVHINGNGGVTGNGKLNGVVIFLVNAEGDIDDFSESDDNGDFDFEDIDVGQFTFQIDIVNFVMVSQSAVATDYDSNTNPSTEIGMQQQSSTGIDEPVTLPSVVTLSQNYPNPFNPQTTIDFTLPANDHVTLGVYSLTGEKVATLIDGESRSAGLYHVNFDASNLPNGTYIYRLQTSAGVIAKRMVELR